MHMLQFYHQKEDTRLREISELLNYHHQCSYWQSDHSNALVLHTEYNIEGECGTTLPMSTSYLI